MQTNNTQLSDHSSDSDEHNLLDSRSSYELGVTYRFRNNMATVENRHTVRGLALRVVTTFFEYDTPKFVHITSKRVGVINRLCQLAIIGYIIGYVIVYKKGYQEFDDVVSGTTSKLKGVAQTNYTALNISGPGGIDFRIWDVADYVVPPQENDAFFVMTNVIVTPGQKQSICPEDPQYRTCEHDSDCKAGEPTPNGNGIQTGNCVPSVHNVSVNVCAIHAWCPVEVDKLPVPNQPLLQGTEDFTVLIKNNIEFPKFKVKSRNILEKQTQGYLQTCNYNASHPTDRYCPVFHLGTMISAADTSYNEIALVGGVVGINIHWNCDLDHSIQNCFPEYSFSRLDSDDAKIAKGTNFRYANFYDRNGTSYRDLYKAYGILFLIRVTGRAGKFSIIPVLLNIGSGIGLLAVATVICDIITLYCLEKGSYYKDNKYQYLTDIEEASNPLVHSDSSVDDDPLLNPGITPT